MIDWHAIHAPALRESPVQCVDYWVGCISVWKPDLKVRNPQRKLKTWQSSALPAALNGMSYEVLAVSRSMWSK